MKMNSELYKRLNFEEKAVYRIEKNSIHLYNPLPVFNFIILLLLLCVMSKMFVLAVVTARIGVMIFCLLSLFSVLDYLINYYYCEKIWSKKAIRRLRNEKNN